ncbi:MAG: RHS repeat-associated core domain-containing protein [Candidatus Aphodosoma sp.]
MRHQNYYSLSVRSKSGFTARCYFSSFSHWLTVDPLADKYPGISPYAYCAWNPIKYVDPDGWDAVLITFPIPHK